MRGSKGCGSMDESCFVGQREYAAFQGMMAGWGGDEGEVLSAFERLLEHILRKNGALLDLKARSGVSFSLRAMNRFCSERKRPLVMLVDIVLDQSSGRWLSVCFYADEVSDEEERGNLVPKGLLDEDGYCFDIESFEDDFLCYVEGRIDEAWKCASGPDNVDL